MSPVKIFAPAMPFFYKQSGAALRDARTRRRPFAVDWNAVRDHGSVIELFKEFQTTHVVEVGELDYDV